MPLRLKQSMLILRRWRGESTCTAGRTIGKQTRTLTILRKGIRSLLGTLKESRKIIIVPLLVPIKSAT